MDELQLLAVPRDPNVYVSVLSAVISVVVAGILTFCCALIAEHEQGFTNSALAITVYVFLALSSTALFAEHRFFFAAVAVWLFYRNLGFEYDVWPVGEWQTARVKFNTLISIATLLCSTALCFDARNNFRTAALLFVFGCFSALQCNPGNDDEEWAQTANLAVFCFLYLVSFFVRRFDNYDNPHLVAMQSLWALQSINFVFLTGGVIFQLCIYVLLLFSQTKSQKNE
jgi:hypothetical protein